jgi:hypothetical protein
MTVLPASDMAIEAMSPEERLARVIYGVCGMIALPVGLAVWAWARRPPLPASLNSLCAGLFALEGAQEVA